ncbi:hypothetical protein FB45DRAFT_735721 [Roridomyces roridus]|uniref:Uncharacterized protein n=1 Tax=Roridomyces roridus TaxID=1738132 RepID=A0AAD7FZ45_9AGAR|nr:hypothetical protein FB45DRAFT_735721 [Roridomyces roridus]
MQIPPRFGLIEESEMRWHSLLDKLRELNDADDTGSYKFTFFGTHGHASMGRAAVHNVAESKYGTDAWDDYGAMLYGDGEIIWGPDPKLTTLGEAQGATAHSVWGQEGDASIPIPLQRLCGLWCSSAFCWLYSCPAKFTPFKDFREEHGAHTCDQRSTRTQIANAFPSIDIEPGLTEVDEAWTAKRETFEHVVGRARDGPGSDFWWRRVVVSVTAHNGSINAFSSVSGRETYALPTGGEFPL